MGTKIHRQAAIRTAIDMGLFLALLDTEEGGITAQELAEKTKADEILVTRIMRVVTATGYAKETGVRHYTSTRKTEIFAPGSPSIDVMVHAFVITSSDTCEIQKLKSFTGHHTLKHSSSSPNTSAKMVTQIRILCPQLLFNSPSISKAPTSNGWNPFLSSKKRSTA
jgi:hypothetical protein